MKVLLLSFVKKVGNKGDVVEVSDGYARNFLFPKKLAKMATADIVKDMKRKEQVKKQTNAQRLDEEKKIRARMKEVTIVLRKKASGESLFASVSTQEIAQMLGELGFSMDAKHIQFPHPIKTVGNHEAEVIFPLSKAREHISICIEKEI